MYNYKQDYITHLNQRQDELRDELIRIEAQKIYLDRMLESNLKQREDISDKLLELLHHR